MEERDTDIIRRYNDGENLRVISKAHALTKEGVRQILLKHNIVLQKRGNPMRSDRTNFLGVEVTDEVKDALKAEAKRRGLSMSSLTATTLQEMLEAVKHA